MKGRVLGDWNFKIKVQRSANSKQKDKKDSLNINMWWPVKLTQVNSICRKTYINTKCVEKS